MLDKFKKHLDNLDDKSADYNERLDVLKRKFQNTSLQSRILFGILVILIITAGISGMHHSSLSQKASDYDLALSAAQNRNADLTEKSQTKYITTPTGANDPDAANTIKAINDLFTKITTYKTAADYGQNWTDVSKIIKDKNFLSKNGFYPPLDTPNDPQDSMIAAKGDKSKTVSVSSYEISSNSFIVFVSQVYYRNDNDLNYLDKLQTTDNAFVVNGSANQIQSVETLNQPLLNN